MHLKTKKTIVWVIAWITALPGIYDLLRYPLGLFHHLKWLFTGVIPDENMPLWMTVLAFVFFLVIYLRPVAGYGLFRLKKWGKQLAIGTLSIDFVIRLIGFIHMWTYYDRHPEARKELEALKNAVASGQTQQVGYVSVIPSYIIAATCLICVIILLTIDFSKLENAKA